MSCGVTCGKKVTENPNNIVREVGTNNGSGLIVIVLYILLAIIIGSYLL